MPIKSIFALTIILYVASGLLVAGAAWFWRDLARTKRAFSARAFRRTARVTAVSLSMLAATLFSDALIAVLANRCGALSPCQAGAASKASVTIHLDPVKPPVEAALIAESDQLSRDCNIGQQSACAAAGQVASALEARGYCQPDASGRWEKAQVCSQIIGSPDLTLGLPRAGEVPAAPPMPARSWRRKMREQS